LATRRNRTQVAPQDAAEEAPYSFVLETGFSLAGVTLYYAGLNSADARSFDLQQTQFARKGYQIAIGIGYHPSRGILSTR